MDPELDETLSLFTDEELAEEMERRQRVKITIPMPLANIDPEIFDRLKGLAHRYLLSLIDDTVRCKDGEHYMYEYVMQMFYGQDIFEKFINPNSG